MTRRRKPASDPRYWVKIACELGDNPKLVEIDNLPVVGWTYVQSILMAGGSMTDGQVMPNHVLRRAGTSGLTVALRGETMAISAALIAQNLWHLPGHDCPHGCPQPRPGFVQIHDYHIHQESKADRQEYIETKRRAGRIGGAKRWHGTAGQDPLPLAAPDDAPAAPAMAPAMPDAMPDAMSDAMQRAARQLEQQHPDQPPRPPTRKATAERRSAISADWTPGQDLLTWAKENTPDIDAAAQSVRFVAHYRGDGSPRKDWASVWQSWMLREQQQVNRRAGNNGRYRDPAGGDAEYRQQWADAP